jgi:hypothetical protein
MAEEAKMLDVTRQPMQTILSSKTSSPPPLHYLYNITIAAILCLLELTSARSES